MICKTTERQLLFDKVAAMYYKCDAMINLVDHIVRKQTENGFHLYGCKLLNDENDRTDLRRFVFKTQIKTRRITLDFG